MIKRADELWNVTFMTFGRDGTPHTVDAVARSGQAAEARVLMDSETGRIGDVRLDVFDVERP